MAAFRNQALKVLSLPFDRRIQGAPGGLGDRIEIGDAGFDEAGKRIARCGEAVGNLIHLAGKAGIDCRTGLVEPVKQAVSSLVDVRCQMFGGGDHLVAERVGRRCQLLAQLFVGAGNGRAQPLGMGDDALALIAQLAQERAHTRLVVGVGALQFGDLVLHQRFKFAGPGDRAFDAFAHRGDFAPDGLADHGHPLLRQIFRRGEAEGDLAHRAGGVAHLLGAADKNGKAKEHDDRDHHADHDRDHAGQGTQLFDRPDLPDIGRIEQMRKSRAGADPDKAENAGPCQRPPAGTRGDPL